MPVRGDMFDNHKGRRDAAEDVAARNPAATPVSPHSSDRLPVEPGSHDTPRESGSGAKDVSVPAKPDGDA
jgi:hypothetical protein